MVLTKDIISSLGKSLYRLPWRPIMSFGLILAAGAYFFLGMDFSKRAAAIGAKSELEHFLDDRSENDPALAADLARLRSEFGDLPVAAKLKLDSVSDNKNSNYAPLSSQLQRQEPLHEIRLIKLFQSSGIPLADPAFEIFLVGFDEAIRILPNPVDRIAVLESLESASKIPDDWRFVQQGYLELLVWRATRETPDLWEYYKREHEWLAALIAERCFIDMKSMAEMGEFGASDLEQRLQSLVQAAYRHHAMIHEMYEVSPKETVNAYHVFECYGEALEITRNRFQIPLDQTVAVLFANPAVFDNEKDGDPVAAPGEAEANFLRQVNDKPNVWKYSQAIPMAMQLYKDVPDYAEEVLNLTGGNPIFIVQIYEAYGPSGKSEDKTLLTNACAAIAKYDLVALKTLDQYKGNEDFRTALADSRINTRIIPFAERFPELIDEATGDPEYVNKVLDENGKFKDHEQWWEALPGGSIFKVADNWRNGYPCDWSEVGWAVYDTADIALMVATVGTSKVVTSSAKFGVKSAGRMSAHVVDDLAELPAKTIKFSRQGVAVTDEVAGIGGKVVPMLKLAARSGDEIVEQGAKALPKTSGSRAGSVIRNTADDIAERIGRASDPKHLGKWRTVAFGMMAVKLYARQDLLKKAPDQMGKSLMEATAAALEIPGRVLAAAVSELLKQLGVNRFPVWPFHLFTTGALLGLAMFTFQLGRPRHVRPL